MTYQSGPVMKTDEKHPAPRPTMIGSENSRTLGTPMTYRVTIVIRVVIFEYSERVSVCVMEASTIFL